MAESTRWGGSPATWSTVATLRPAAVGGTLRAPGHPHSGSNLRHFPLDRGPGHDGEAQQ